MLMFSLPELLNIQGTQKERDSFQFTQRGQLQVHAFDKGSSPHNTGEWKLMYGSHYPFHSFLWHSGWMAGQSNRELWRGSQDGNEEKKRTRSQGHHAKNTFTEGSESGTFLRFLMLFFWRFPSLPQYIMLFILFRISMSLYFILHYCIFHFPNLLVMMLEPKIVSQTEGKHHFILSLKWHHSQKHLSEYRMLNFNFIFIFNLILSLNQCLRPKVDIYIYI